MVTFPTNNNFMDAKTNAQEIQDLLRRSEEIISELPPDVISGLKTIKGERHVLDELREFMNVDGEVISEVRTFARYDSSGMGGLGVAILSSISAISGALVAYFHSKKRKITITVKGRKLVVENYTVGEIERIAKCFDSISIE